VVGARDEVGARWRALARDEAWVSGGQRPSIGVVAEKCRT